MHVYFTQNANGQMWIDLPIKKLEFLTPFFIMDNLFWRWLSFYAVCFYRFVTKLGKTRRSFVQLTVENHLGKLFRIRILAKTVHMV